MRLMKKHQAMKFDTAENVYIYKKWIVMHLHHQNYKVQGQE